MAGKVKGVPSRPRSPGHVTELVGKLRKWRDARKRKDLDVRELERAILYLEEYRNDALPVLHGLWRSGIETKRT